ncbi:MAG: hypothetical protein HYX24_04735 [Candidatus Aenigmarchaeota archaeon]|nr:hypothetical protein [Candidatus Aenigmarchaeota archaeon]
MFGKRQMAIHRDADRARRIGRVAGAAIGIGLAAASVGAYLSGSIQLPGASARLQTQAAGYCGSEEDQRKQKERKLMTFPGFENPIYSVHDGLIIDYTDSLNRLNEGLPGYTCISPNLIKAQALTESGGKYREKEWKEDPFHAWLNDPMQISNKDSFPKGALGVMSGREKRECGIPEGGYPELREVSPAGKHAGEWDYRGTGIDAGLSIESGIDWDGHKRMKFDANCNVTGMKTEREMLEAYNGKKEYASKVMNLLRKGYYRQLPDHHP